MSISPTFIVLVIVLMIIVILITVFGLYKLISYLIQIFGTDQPINSPSVLESNLRAESDPMVSLDVNSIYKPGRKAEFLPRVGTSSRLVEPIVKRRNNFLEILDRLSTLGDDEEEDRIRKRREERRRNMTDTSSSTGIEAESTDETASQTLIGKEPKATPEPGRIQLSLIKARNTNVTGEDLA